MSSSSDSSSSSSEEEKKKKKKKDKKKRQEEKQKERKEKEGPAGRRETHKCNVAFAGHVHSGGVLLGKHFIQKSKPSFCDDAL